MHEKNMPGGDALFPPACSTRRASRFRSHGMLDGCSMLRDNFLREEFCDSEAAQRDHYPVIAISHYRNEIRQQVDGAQSITSHTEASARTCHGTRRSTSVR